MVYKRFAWKEGSHLSIDPQAAGERLGTIEKKYGAVTPELVVSDARSTRSPLHEAFEWKDAVAAEKYREEQAKYLLRSIVVTIEEAGKQFEDVRAFVSIETCENDRAYISLTKALSDDDLRGRIIDQALRELEQWRRRYEQYKELGSLMKSISKFTARKTA